MADKKHDTRLYFLCFSELFHLLVKFLWQTWMLYLIYWRKQSLGDIFMMFSRVFFQSKSQVTPRIFPAR